MLEDERPGDSGSQSVEDFSPYRLLTDFTRPRITTCVIVALVIHVVVIGATSWSYFLGGEKDDQQKQVADGKNGSADGQPASAPASRPAKTGDRKPEDGTSPIEKKITEKPKPGELPKGPGDIGLDIEDTN